MKTDNWYVINRGKIAGPYHVDQLAAQRAKGVFTSFIKVSQDKALWIPIDELLIQAQAQKNAPAPVVPPRLDGLPASIDDLIAGTSQQRHQRIKHSEIIFYFPVIALVILHYATVCIYTFFAVTGSHGKLPRLKTDDPSGAKAISLCFVPFYNLYWIAIVFARLARRINALSAAYHLPKLVPVPLAYVMSFLIIVPLSMFLAGSILLIFTAFSDGPNTEILLLFFTAPTLVIVANLILIAPFFVACVQRGLNQISLAQLELLLQSQT